MWLLYFLVINADDVIAGKNIQCGAFQRKVQGSVTGAGIA